MGAMLQAPIDFSRCAENLFDVIKIDDVRRRACDHECAFILSEPIHYDGIWVDMVAIHERQILWVSTFQLMQNDPLNQFLGGGPPCHSGFSDATIIGC